MPRCVLGDRAGCMGAARTQHAAKAGGGTERDGRVALGFSSESAAPVKADGSAGASWGWCRVCRIQSVTLAVAWRASAFCCLMLLLLPTRTPLVINV